MSGLAECEFATTVATENPRHECVGQTGERDRDEPELAERRGSGNPIGSRRVR